MGLDIRWPIGLMFTLIGALLTILGIVAPDMSKPPKNVGIDIRRGEHHVAEMRALLGQLEVHFLQGGCQGAIAHAVGDEVKRPDAGFSG